MPSFNTKLSVALKSADDVTVQLPGSQGQEIRADKNFDEWGDDGNGNMVFFPITLSLENNPEDLIFDEADVTVTDGVVRVNDKRQGRPIIIMLRARRPLGQQDLIDKNA